MGKGRCGEWAIAFMCICRVFNLRARFVEDVTDHVWTEIYSEHEQRWLHVDPCENIIDLPLTYEVGWKKELSFIVAYSFDSVKDVTWRYTNKISEVKDRRDQALEQWLNNLINKTNIQVICDISFNFVSWQNESRLKSTREYKK